MHLVLFGFLFLIILKRNVGLIASSECLQMEYVAVFVAFLFPGALVAFDSESLQQLPCFAALRIYCAGIWHNAVVCLLAFWLFIERVNLFAELNADFYSNFAVLCGLWVRLTTPAFHLVTVLRTW